jgi:hypothetical protein
MQAQPTVDVDLEVNVAYTLAALLAIYLTYRFIQGDGKVREAAEDLGGADAAKAAVKGVAGA